MEDQEQHIEDSPAVISTVTDIAETFATGVPAPLRKNVLKVIGQLLSAVVDVPVASLEGRAAEIRAISKARVTAITQNGASLSAAMKVPEAYIAAASEKFAQKIIREQLNLDRIATTAVRQLDSNTHPSNASSESDDVPQPEEISTDWLNAFSSIAKDMSSEKMQNLFAKILANEIAKPDSFSLKTVHTLAYMSQPIANLFQIACSMCFSLRAYGQIVDARILTLGKTGGENGLLKYGLNYSSLLILEEHGLLVTELSSRRDYTGSILKDNSAEFLGFQGKNIIFVKSEPLQIEEKLRLSGVAFSTTGRELLSIIDIIPQDEYAQDLKEYLATMGITAIQPDNSPGL